MKKNFIRTVCGVGYLDGASRYHYLYPRWYNMLHRCYVLSDPDYRSYGAKNIKVSERWHSFRNFIKDAPFLEGFDKKLIKEGKLHIDKDKNSGENKIYSSEKCIWITPEENCKLMKQTKQIKMKTFRAIRLSDNYEEISYNQSEFARKYNLSRSKIGEVLSGKYLIHKGWKFERME
jgi:predicted DNA-binding protein (UPF0251 family)